MAGAPPQAVAEDRGLSGPLLIVLRLKAASEDRPDAQHFEQTDADKSGDVTFEIDTGGENYRYYVIWLRLPREGGQAEINEVTART
mgnify:CR=1 FL=1